MSDVLDEATMHGAGANRRFSIVATGVACTLLGLAFVLVNLAQMESTIEYENPPYVRLYDHPDTKYEVLVNQGDGQAFAALAQDPLLRRPEVFRAGTDEAAYRAQRPLLGWLGWALSGGQASRVPTVLVVLAVIGYGALGAALAASLAARGAPLWGAFVVLVTPGAIVTLDWTGPEAATAALALLGLLLWQRERPALAAGALLAASLGRETLLIVPLAILAHDLIVLRSPVRRLLPLLVPVAGFGVWVLVLWLRLDALPTGAGNGRLGMPLAGLLQGAEQWQSDDAVYAGLILFVAAIAAIAGRRDPAGWVAGCFLVASVLLGADVWKRMEDFGRVLLPMLSFGVVVLIAQARTGSDRPSVAGSDDGEPDALNGEAQRSSSVVVHQAPGASGADVGSDKA